MASNAGDMTTDTTRTPIILKADEGEHFHFLGNLATVKVAAGDDGQLSAVEFLAPRSFGPPLHRHNDEDELFVIFEGQLALRAGDVEQVGGPGTCALLPRGLPHGFQVLSETARFLNVTGATASAPQFDRMVTALGQATDDLQIPPPAEIDPARVAEVCAAHGIDILGPPPSPLD